MLNQLRLKISDSFAAIWFAAFNAVTFLAFGLDKWRASRSGSRVPETSLAILGALGGWLGGLFGMIVFRHKTAKWTFKFKYAIALISFCGRSLGLVSLAGCLLALLTSQAATR